MELPKPERLLNFRLNAVTSTDLIDLISQAIASDSKITVASMNLHGLYVWFNDEKMRALHEDGRTIVHIDGTSLIWLARLFGLRLTARHRTAWLDWFDDLLQRVSGEGWKIYCLGTRPEVLRAALKNIRGRYPGLAIEGHHGYFDPDPASAESRKIVADINRFGANILIVGMGMGRQEGWIVDHIDSLNVNCIGTTGACLEFVAGFAKAPPRWTGPMGVEWLYRFATDPSRFWRRYFVEPWHVARMIVASRRDRSA